MKNNKGITLIALIITIIIMLILASITVNIAQDVIEDTKLESLVTDMISIKAKAKTIEEKYNFKDIDNLVGTKLDEDVDTEGIQTSYNISNELKEELSSLENIDKLYVWTEEDLENQGLSNIKTNETNFYIIYYNLEQKNTCEVYYSLGYEGKYSLSAINEI